METLEWTKHSDAMFKSWTDAQTNMWNEWVKAMQGFGNISVQSGSGTRRSRRVRRTTWELAQAMPWWKC